MRKALQNICCEFSDSYVCENTSLYTLLSAKINIDDLNDFAQVLSSFGLELQEIQASSASDANCVAIFTKTHEASPQIDPSGAFFGDGNFDLGLN